MQAEMAMGRGMGRWTYIPNHVSATVVDGVGDEAHEADGAAAVDQVYAPLHLQCTQNAEHSSQPGQYTSRRKLQSSTRLL